MILVTVTHHASDPYWAVRVTPSSYNEAAKTQLSAMPGLTWVRDKSTANGAGYYKGPVEAARIVSATLEAAGIARVKWDGGRVPPTDSYLGKGLETTGLRDYQRDAVAWLRWELLTTRGALLADEMGLGKTAATISALDAACPEGRILIVCPAVVVPHWEAQITRWGTRFGHSTGDLEFSDDAAGRAFHRRVAKRWHVTSYEQATKAGANLTWGAVVLDEIHYLMNPKAVRSKAVAALLEANPQALRIGLSGTPMTARPSDLWHPLHLLHPERWGNQWQFQKRYCAGRYEEIKAIGKSVWVADGSSHEAELATRLQAVMMRRTKAQVATELPKLTRQVIEVELPAKARRGLDGSILSATSDGPSAAPMRMRVADLLSASEEHKTSAAIDLARDIIASGGRPLILTLRRETADRIGTALLSPVVNGDTPANERAATLQQPGAPAGVATLASVTTGIDLIAFDCAIMVGLDWLPSAMLQGEGRVHRLGQDRPVTIYYLVGIGTIDEAVRERVIDRLDTFAVITGGDATGGMGLTLAGGTEEELLASLVSAVMAA